MLRISNQTKVVLCSDKIENQVSIKRSNCIVVQSYAFDVKHNRNAYGESYGNCEGGIMEMTIRIGARDDLKFVYERLKQNTSSPFSVLFNVVYDEDDAVKTYDAALMADAYVVDVVESFDSNAPNEEGEQILLTMKLLLASLTYLGENNSSVAHCFSN